MMAVQVNPVEARVQRRFQSLRAVGSGTMGTVYKGWDCKGGCDVAIKVMRGGSGRGRFAREAHVLSRLDHPNIVRYVAHGVSTDQEPWLAMEWLEGEDLGVRLERGPLGIGETFALALHLADALGVAHAQGLVHRDLKPSNIFLPRGEILSAKILDFGLVGPAAGDAAITATGTIMGTLEYMPPEQAIDAKRADARADVYSLGAVLFHCLTGRPPHEGDSVHALLSRLLSHDAPSVRELRPGTPVAFAELVDAMLSRDRARRPLNAYAVKAALRSIRVEHAESVTAIMVSPNASPQAMVAATVLMDEPRAARPSSPSAPPSSPRPSSPPPSSSRASVPSMAHYGAARSAANGAAFAVLSFVAAALVWWWLRIPLPFH